MEFSNLYFIYLFLPLCLAVYFLIPGMRRKNMALIVASLLLYAMGQPYYVPLLLLTAYVNYLLGRRVRVGERKTLLLPLLINLGVLVSVKYLGYFRAARCGRRWCAGLGRADRHFLLYFPARVLPC